MKRKTGNVTCKMLLILLLLGLVVPGISACGSDGSDDKKTDPVEVNISDYCTFVFTGKDSKGTATCNFEGEELFDALMEHPDREEFFEDNEDDLEELIDSVTVELTQKSELSNGDMIPMEVEYDEDLAEDLEIEFLYPDIEVTGLEEPLEYDLFDDVEVTFSGVSPYIDVNTKHDINSPIGYFELDTDKKYYAKGETVVVTADCDPEAKLNTYYIKINSIQKEYIADVEFEFLSDVSLLKDETELYDQIHEQMRDEMNGTLTEYEIILYDLFEMGDVCGEVLFGSDAQVNGQVVIDSAYYLTINPEDFINYHTTQLIIIYKVPISFPCCPEETRYVYFTAILYDVMNDDAGAVTADLTMLDTTWNYGHLEGEAYEKLITEQEGKYQVVAVPVEDIPAFPYEVVIGPAETEETTVETTS